MTRLIALLLTLGLVLPSTAGCVVRTQPGHHHKASRGRCHPSEHWDGHKCKHNGKGRGARKHDHR